MLLEIRHVIAADADRLRHLRLQSLQADPAAFGSTYDQEVDLPADHWTHSAAASEAGEVQRTYVVVGEDDRWLGLALVRVTPERGAGLYAMWVAPEARGTGAAALLCDACAAWAAERGHAEIRLWVYDFNAAAIRAYERAGFTITGQASLTRDGVTFPQYTMARRLRGPRTDR